jgi:hypothetical protein
LSFAAGEGSSFDMEMASEVEREQLTVKQDRCRRVKREGAKKGKYHS